MVEELERCLPAFSLVNRTRCFTHILNLIAKSILKLFDIKKPKLKAKTKGDEGSEENGKGDGDEDDGDGDGEDNVIDSEDCASSDGNEPDPELSAEEGELLELAGDIDEEELTIRRNNQVDDDEADDEDHKDGWVDEVEELTAAEQAKLKESILPVSRMLVKVLRKKAYF